MSMQMYTRKIFNFSRLLSPYTSFPTLNMNYRHNNTKCVLSHRALFHACFRNIKMNNINIFLNYELTIEITTFIVPENS